MEFRCRVSKIGCGMLLTRPNLLSASRRWATVEANDAKPLPRTGIAMRHFLTSGSAMHSAGYLPKFDRSFRPNNFGPRLEELNKKLENGTLEAARIQRQDLDSLSSCCEEWMSVRQIAKRNATDLHAVLRAHALLHLPLSATLRANTRRWLDVKLLAGLEPAELFPFFGSLSALSVGVAAANDEELPTSTDLRSDQLLAEMQWLLGVASAAHRQLQIASTIDMLRLLGDFSRALLTPMTAGELRSEIIDKLFDRLTVSAKRLSLEKCVAIVNVMRLAGMKPVPEFWPMLGVSETEKINQNSSSMEKPRQKTPFTDPHHQANAYRYRFLTPSRQIISQLEKLEMAAMLGGAEYSAMASRSFANRIFAKQTSFWPTLLERAKDVGQFKGDWQLFRSLIRVLRLAPVCMTAEVDALVKLIASSAVEEATEVINNIPIKAAHCKSGKRLYKLIHRHLQLVKLTRDFSLDGQMWHPETCAESSVHDILHNISSVPSLVHDYSNSMTPPPAAWWAAFRQRLASDFDLSTNWSTLQLVNQLLSSPWRNLPQCQRHQYLLPPEWYGAMLQLATRLGPSDYSIAVLVRVLNEHRIQFDGEHQLAFSALIERFCATTDQADQFVPTLVLALQLQVPASPAIWQRVCEVQPSPKLAAAKHLLLPAASYFALGLPAAPSANVLRHLVKLSSFDKAWGSGSLWRRLNLLLDDQIISQQLLEMHSPKPQVFKGHRFKGDQMLEGRLVAEYGAPNVQMNAELKDVADITVDYLVTTSDGRRKAVICDSANLHYWRMPADEQGDYTLWLRIKRHLILKAGYEFELVKAQCDQLE